MTIWWPNSHLIQPRTSLGKSDVSGTGLEGWEARAQVRRGVGVRGTRPGTHLSASSESSRSHRHDRKTLSEARSRLDRRRSWPPNSHFAEFFKISKICTLLHRSELKILKKILQIFQKFVKIFEFFENLNFQKCVFFSFSKSRIFWRNFRKFEIRAAHNCENLVDR